MSRLRIAPVFMTFALLTGSVTAQELDRRNPDPLPFGLEGALDEMLEQLKPALRDLTDLMKSFEGIDDPRHYAMPEILPNGDIIIRRREDAPAWRGPLERDRDFPDIELPPRSPRDEAKT